MAQKKLLCWLIFPVVCWGNEAGLNELMKSQDTIVNNNMEQAMDFINESKENISQHDNQAVAIINNVNTNVDCSLVGNYPLFNDLNLGEQQTTMQELSHNSPVFYIFVSLAMPTISLERLAIEAKKTNASLVLRGLKNNSYKETATFLHDIIARTGNGFLIEPELFKKYLVTSVPQFVLVNGLESKYDKITGNITTQYALEQMVGTGDLSKEAIELLKGLI